MGVSELKPSIPPKILVASMILTRMRGIAKVTMAKYIPLSRNTGRNRRVQSAAPAIVAMHDAEALSGSGENRSGTGTGV